MRKALVEIVDREGVRTLTVLAEEPIYEWHNVLVSSSRVSDRGRSYPISDVSSVRVMRPRSRSMLAMICAAVSTALALSAFIFESGQWAVYAIASLVVALVFRPPTTRYVQVDVGPERLTISCSDPVVAAEIADAISVARRAAHSAKRGPAFLGEETLVRAASTSGAA